MLYIMIIFIFCLIFIIKAVEIASYIKSTYYKSTKTPYFAMLGDIGRKGEYLIYKQLKFLEAQGCKFLFNVYIPKENGETTEIDVLLITHKGIIVFESKNYSGWIFGNEKYKNWTQTLPQGKGKSHKEHFFNPIMQNNLHISCLKKLIGDSVPTASIIVFSERCTLKDITVYSNDVQVIKRNDVAAALNKYCNSIVNSAVSDNEIQRLYNLLYPYSQIDAQQKLKHIENINKNHYTE